jgi:hypothetical protein
MFMNKEFTDPDIIESTVNSRVEHSAEVIVLWGRGVDRVDGGFADTGAAVGGLFFICKRISS